MHTFFSPHRIQKKNDQGFTLVEAVVASSVCLVAILGLMLAFGNILKLALTNTAKVQSVFLEEEGQEAVRVLRDNGWTVNIASKTSGTPFYLNWDGTTWNSTTTYRLVDNEFERKVVLTDVNRDASKNIVTSGGSLDANIKLVTVSVAWSSNGATTTRSLSTYITNIFNN